MEKGTSSQPSSRSSYEVFLNFRGEDSRNTFTDFLYHYMVTTGIIVFRDSESLHVGQKIGELLQVIENSQIYIPIFSEKYGSSRWCLRELAHMVECTSKSNGNKEILPIFLGVKPDDVKLKTDLYTRNFSKRQKTLSLSEEESWKKALIEVAKIRGWTWKKDESQVKLIEDVVQTVVAKLNIRSKISVSEHLVGVDNQVQDIIEKLDVGCDGVRFLGIHGMGGIGKTTLAKVVFIQLSSHFKDCHFLLDVGESSRRNGLLDLQKQLLSKFSPISVQIDNEDDGINKIKRVLFSKKVLIVLDDVDEKKQLKNLAGKGSWFGSGSRIIVTTRDQSVLAAEEEVMDEGSVEKSTNVLTHEVCEMEFDHALKLFSRHAFRRDYPHGPYVSLSEKIVSKLGRLPLALEIIGSSLSNKSEALWVETLKKLKKAPPDEVQSKLMISYERLSYSQQQVFLDIACFFIGEDKTYPCYVWDACEYYPHNALEALFLKSLIKIKDNNRFWMHDQVRDLGRNIVLRENFDDPYERSRVWKHEEALTVLKRKEGNQRIKALSLGYLPKDMVLNLADLPKLRFFRACGGSLVGDFNNPLSSLTWLSCHCSSDFGPNNSCLPNLVVLDLSSSGFSEEGIGWIKAARKLKVLNLIGCDYLTRTPDLSMLVSLEILDLEGCKQLVEIHPSIGELKHLTTLKVRGCCSLQELPEGIGCLQVLTKVALPHMPPEFEYKQMSSDLKSQLALDLSTTQISKLPPWIGGITKITVLSLRGCRHIEDLPDWVWNLQSLIELDFSETRISHLSDSIGNLKQLMVLRMRKIKTIRKLPSTIWLLEKLEVLDANGCTGLTGEIPEDIERLPCLRILDLSLTQLSRLPLTVSCLTNLQEFNLHGCYELICLPELPPSLARLTCGGDRGLSVYDLPTSISNLTQLTFLYLSSMHVRTCNFTRLDALFQLEMKRLTCLWLNNCEFRPEVVDLSHMKNLQKVFMKGCKLLVEICGLEELGSLSSLIVLDCSSIERMSDLSKLRKLRELTVEECPKLRRVEGLNHLESLDELRIHDCESLESLADTSNLELSCLTIVGCGQVPDRPAYCAGKMYCGCVFMKRYLQFHRIHS